MATEDRREADRLSLFRRLEDAAWEFDFFQALRRIECLHPEWARLGKALRPSEEPVRLALEVSLGFAPATFSRLTPQGHGLPPRLEQRFLGLLGPNGPLPLHLTEYALERITHHGDLAFSRFLDIFHHRMLLLFYRAWADAQPTVGKDRPSEDRFAFYLGSLLGLGTEAMRARDAMPDTAKFFFAGRLAKHSRNAEGLESMLYEYLQLPVQVEQFVPHWLQLPVDQRTRLGGVPRESTALGRGTVIGEQVRDVQCKFRIRLGPMNAEQYDSFLPGRRNLLVLVAWVRNYVGFEFEWDLVLVLASDEVIGSRLGEKQQLGWTAWLGTRSAIDAAEDLTLAPEQWQRTQDASHTRTNRGMSHG